MPSSPELLEGLMSWLPKGQLDGYMKLLASVPKSQHSVVAYCCANEVFNHLTLASVLSGGCKSEERTPQLHFHPASIVKPDGSAWIPTVDLTASDGESSCYVDVSPSAPSEAPIECDSSPNARHFSPRTFVPQREPRRRRTTSHLHHTLAELPPAQDQPPAEPPVTQHSIRMNLSITSTDSAGPNKKRRRTTTPSMCNDFVYVKHEGASPETALIVDEESGSGGASSESSLLASARAGEADVVQACESPLLEANPLDFSPASRVGDEEAEAQGEGPYQPRIVHFECRDLATDLTSPWSWSSMYRARLREVTNEELPLMARAFLPLIEETKIVCLLRRVQVTADEAKRVFAFHGDSALGYWVLRRLGDKVFKRTVRCRSRSAKPVGKNRISYQFPCLDCSALVMVGNEADTGEPFARCLTCGRSHVSWKDDGSCSDLPSVWQAEQGYEPTALDLQALQKWTSAGGVGLCVIFSVLACIGPALSVVIERFNNGELLCVECGLGVIAAERQQHTFECTWCRSTIRSRATQDLAAQPIDKHLQAANEILSSLQEEPSNEPRRRATMAATRKPSRSRSKKPSRRTEMPKRDRSPSEEMILPLTSLGMASSESQTCDGEAGPLWQEEKLFQDKYSELDMNLSLLPPDFEQTLPSEVPTDLDAILHSDFYPATPPAEPEAYEQDEAP